MGVETRFLKGETGLCLAISEKPGFRVLLPEMITNFLRDYCGCNRVARSCIVSQYLSSLPQANIFTNPQQHRCRFRAVADLGRYALEETRLDAILDAAIAYVAEVLAVPYVAIWELLPNASVLYLRSGVGWKLGLVGRANESISDKSQAGYTLRSSAPIVVEDLRFETRFGGSQILHQHAIVSGVSVIIEGNGEQPFGVLSAHSCQQRGFSDDDIEFLTAIADILAAAVDRLSREEALNRFFELSVDMFSIARTDGYFQRVNPRFESLLGYNCQQLLGQPLLEFIHPDDRATTQAQLDNLALGLSVSNFENRYRTADGSYLWFSWSAMPSPSDDLIYAVAREIGDRKQAEEAWRQLNQNLENTIEQRTAQLRDANHKLLEEIHDRAAIELALKQQVQQQAIVAELGQKALSGIPLRQLIAETVLQVARGLKVEYCKILETDAERTAFLTLAVRDETGNYAILANEPANGYELKIETLSVDPQPYRDNCHRGLSVGICGQTNGWGELAVYSDRTHRYNNDDVHFLQSAANVLAAAFDRDTTERHLQWQNEKARLFANIALKIRQSLHLDEILQTTVSEVRKMLQCDRAIVYQVFPDGTGCTISEEVLPGWPKILDICFPPETFPPEYQQLYRTGKVKAIDDTYKSYADVTPCLVEFLDGWCVRAKLVVPILQNHDLWGFIIAHQCRSPRQWTEFEIELLQPLANQVGIALAQAQLLEALRLSERAIAASSNGIVLVDATQPHFPTVFVNPAFERTTGYSAAEVIGRNCRFLQGNDTEQPELDVMRKALKNRESCTVVVRNYRKDGSLFWNELSLSPIYDSAGKLTHYLGIQNDITETRRTELERQVVRERLQYLLASSPGILYSIQATPDYHATFVSHNALTLLGYTEDQMKAPGFWYSCLHPEDARRIQTVGLEPLFDRGTYSHEYRFRKQDGTYCWIYDQLKLVRDKSGQPLEIIGYWVDISDRKQVEGQLVESLREKEVLLKEIHHRVKNNLQIVSSLLKLQSGYIDDDRAVMLFQDCYNRVRSMALIHEKLYRTDDLTSIDAAEYLENLALNLFSSYRGDRVELKLECDRIPLDIDTAIPCGLIVTELVSNALKYAFPNGKKGRLRVQLRRADRGLELAVSDDGIGLPANFNIEEVDSLGLQLVSNLTAQLDGVLSLDTREGTKFSIQF